MNNNVRAAEPFTNRVGHDCAAFGRGHVCRDEEIGVRSFGGGCSSSSENPHTLLAQSRYDGQPNTLRAARDERPAAFQFKATHWRSPARKFYRPQARKRAEARPDYRETLRSAGS